MVTFASACRPMRSGVSNKHYKTHAAAHVYERLFWPLVEQNIYIAIRGAIRLEAQRAVGREEAS